MWTLVTGASGFVGSHVVAALVAEGTPVIALQRNRKLLPGIPDHDTDNFRRIFGDLTEEIDINVSISSVVHCAAAVVHPGATATDFANGNVLTAFGVVRLIRKLGSVKIFLMSSISIYGGGNREILTEESTSISPGPYGASKYLVEQMFQELASKSDVTVIRTPGIVGKRANPNWLTKTMHKLVSDQDITLTNPDFKFNHFVHVDDVVGYLKFRLTCRASTGFYTINFAPNATKTLKGVVDFIREALKSDAVVSWGDSTGVISEISSIRNDPYKLMTLDQTLQRFVRDELDEG